MFVFSQPWLEEGIDQYRVVALDRALLVLHAGLCLSSFWNCGHFWGEVHIHGCLALHFAVSFPSKIPLFLVHISFLCLGN